MAILLLALSACVRPAPDAEDLPTATATIPGLLPNPTLPPVAASPTPLPVPAEASPTPPPAPAEASPTPPPAEPTAPPAVVDPTAAPTGETIHVVQAGENLFRIGLRYGFTAQELATYNNIPNVDRIYVGQQIRIPPR
jgi:2',3'-cyclic-nucleotide 2'-phosphodiesterase/3'-nucleotidase